MSLRNLEAFIFNAYTSNYASLLLHVLLLLLLLLFKLFLTFSSRFCCRSISSCCGAWKHTL